MTTHSINTQDTHTKAEEAAPRVDAPSKIDDAQEEDDETERNTDRTNEAEWKFRLGDNWAQVQSIFGSSYKKSVFRLSPPASPERLDAIVVKQRDSKGEIVRKTFNGCEGNSGSTIKNASSIGLKAAAEAYELMNGANSTQVSRMCRRWHEDYDEGTGAAGDRGSQVEGIVLEYCPGGTLDDLMTTINTDDLGGLEEEDIRYIFHQLALACSICHRGTASLKDKDAWSNEIVHLNISLDNVMFGAFENDHARLPQLQLTDFDVAINVSRYSEEAVRRIEYQHFIEGNYELVHAAPEMCGSLVTNGDTGSLEGKQFKFNDIRLGSATNIYQIGRLIHILMQQTSGKIRDILAGNDKPPDDALDGYKRKCTFLIELTGKTPSYGKYNYNPVKTIHCSANTDPDWDSHFSKELQTLVNDVMADEPHNRPTSTNLQIRTAAGLRKSHGTAKRVWRDIKQSKDCPTYPLGTDPPPEWEIVDSNTISVMVQLYHRPGRKPWYIILQDLPQTMTIGLLERTLAIQTRGRRSDSDLNRPLPFYIPPHKMKLHWNSIELSPNDTIGSVGIQNMDVLWCFQQKQEETVRDIWARQRKRAREIDTFAEEGRPIKRTLVV